MYVCVVSELFTYVHVCTYTNLSYNITLWLTKNGSMTSTWQMHFVVILWFITTSCMGYHTTVNICISKLQLYDYIHMHTYSTSKISLSRSKAGNVAVLLFSWQVQRSRERKGDLCKLLHSFSNSRPSIFSTTIVFTLGTWQNATHNSEIYK